MSSTTTPTFSVKSYKSVLFFKCVATLTLFNSLQSTDCAPSLVISSDYEIPTEPPELVETFNPLEWISRARLGQQVTSLKKNYHIYHPSCMHDYRAIYLTI